MHFSRAKLRRLSVYVKSNIKTKQFYNNIYYGYEATKKCSARAMHCKMLKIMCEFQIAGLFSLISRAKSQLILVWSVSG